MSESIVHQKILVVPVGAVDPYILTVVADAFEGIFHCKAGTGKEISIPEYSYNPGENSITRQPGVGKVCRKWRNG